MTDAAWATVAAGKINATIRPHRWKFKRGPTRDHFTRENPGICRLCGQRRYYGRPRTRAWLSGSLPSAFSRPVEWAAALQCPAAPTEVGQ